MVEQRKDYQLEDLMDALLSGYSAVSPRPGLEKRVLASVRAQTARQRRSWMFVFAAAGAAVLMAGLVTIWRSAKPTSSHESAKVLVATPMVRDRKETASPSPLRARRRLAHTRSQDVVKPPDLLRVVDAMHGEGRLVFAEEKLYLHPVPATDPEPATAEERSAPSITIDEVGVQPIAIKELSAEKEIDKEGRL